MTRTRNLVAQMIECNYDYNNHKKHTFLTLTFAKNVTNIKQANYEFKKFIQRLNYQYNIQSKYVAVIEFQKRKAIHYHIVFFNIPFIPKEIVENKLWGNGFTRIEQPRDVHDLSRYVSKYMTKDLIDRRLVGQKAYFTSKHIKRPIHSYNPEVINLFKNYDNIEALETYENTSYKKIKYAFNN